ncbi:MAG TPA: FAD-binding protein [Terracidiphilus sp.]|jgi:FAD/FMN-containing dehydrogenase|nr:FAD-binding protein [Terracidiphilus sp.]
MATNSVSNWFGNVVSHPAVIVDAYHVEDIVAVMKDPAKYPSPVRAIGSNHSNPPCGSADGGTLIRMKMNQILSIGGDTLTAQAGAIQIDMVKALEARNLQFYVNTEIGSLSAGSAAIAGTKDASFEGEFGQVGSYIIGMKMVLPSGELMEVTEAAQPDLMMQLRSSYGLFGIVYEVTFKIRPLIPMHVHHETFSLGDFLAALPSLKARGDSMFFYMFPFSDRITVEFRRYNPGATGDPNRIVWELRNHIWGTSGPKLGYEVTKNIAEPQIRYGIIDAFNDSWRVTLDSIVQSDNTHAGDQTIYYPPVSTDSRYTFSLFAFPEEQYPATLSEFWQFINDYYRRTGYRTNLLCVGYRIAADQKSLFSYSYEGGVMTIDPVSTANDGWYTFLDVYNQWCSDRNGVPLLNQTPNLTAPIVRKAYGAERIAKFLATRQQFDPQNRLMNPYFAQMFSLGASA